MTAGQPMITCPVCGTLNTPDRVFCRKCASDLHATIVLPGQAPPPPPRAEVPIKPILVGGGLALLLILAAIAAVVAFGALSPSSTSSPSPSVESTAPVLPSAKSVSSAASARFNHFHSTISGPRCPSRGSPRVGRATLLRR